MGTSLGDVSGYAWILKTPPSLRDRSEFNHPDLPDWALRERIPIFAAILTIAWARIRDGRTVTEESPRFAILEDWCEKRGGILSAMRIGGFLKNLDRQYDEADIEGPQWGAFPEEWYEGFGDRALTVAGVVTELEKNVTALYGDQSVRGCAPDEVLEAIAARGRGTQKLGQLLRHR